MSQNELLFLPLGGVGEIGMNLALYGFGPEAERQWIMVDCGVTFPGPDLPGVDLVLPDIRYVEELGDALKAIVITHAHEDHYGALQALWPRLQKPVWASPFAAAMLEAKAQSEPDASEIPVNIFKAGDRFGIGPFEVEAVHVTHSIPEPVSLAIRTPAGLVIHTADWKLDPQPGLGADTDAERFQRLGEEGVLALICDSTNALRDGPAPSESEVNENLRKVIESATGRVAITTFSSHVGRIRSIAKAAHDAGRKVMLMGRSMRRVADVADTLGYLEGLDDFVEEDEFDSIDRSRIAIILTGSQGEGRAALAKLSRDEHPRVHLSAGDTVVYSSRTIPGNEKPIIETVNRLTDMGVRIVTPEDELVHVSGHPRRDELLKMYGWTRPQVLVPVHGEAVHLSAQAALGAKAGIPQVAPIRNGDMLRLSPGAAEVIDSAPSGRLLKDGRVIGDTQTTGVSERRKLSYAGLVACSVVLDRHGRMADEIDIALHGLPETLDNGDAFEDVLYDAAVGAAESIPPGRRKNPELVERAVTRAIRAAARDNWGKKPVVTVFVAKV